MGTEYRGASSKNKDSAREGASIHMTIHHRREFKEMDIYIRRCEYVNAEIYFFLSDMVYIEYDGTVLVSTESQ